MLRSGNAIRLTADEKLTLEKLTGTKPDGIHSVESLNNFVDFHKGLYADNTPEEKLLMHLLEDWYVAL